MLTRRKSKRKIKIIKKKLKKMISNRIVRPVLVGILIILIVGIVHGCGKTKSEIVFTTGLSDNEVFKIDGNACTLPEAMLFLTTLQNQYENTYGEQMWSQNLGNLSLEEYVKEMTISQLAQIKSMNLLAERMEIQLLEEDKALIASMADKYYSGLTEDEINYMGITKEDVMNLYSQFILANRTYEEITKGVDTEVSDDEARVITVKQIFIKTYKEDEAGNRTYFNEEEKAAASTRINEIANKAANGEDFDILVQKYNEGISGEVAAARGDLESQVEEVAFSMENDTISGIIETKSGYYIIKCINRFNQVETDIHKISIAEKRKSDAFYEVYNDFARNLPSEFNDKLWKSVILKSSDGVNTENFFSIFNQYHL